MKGLTSVIFMSIVIVNVVNAGHIKICLPKDSEKDALDDLTTVSPTPIPKWEFDLPKVFNDLMKGHVKLENIIIDDNLELTICLGLWNSNVTIKALNMKADHYSMRVDVDNLLDLYGDGKFDVSLEGLNIFIGNMDYWDIVHRCIKLDIVNMTLDKSTVNFTNLMDGSKQLNEVLNQLMSDVIPDFIQYYFPIVYKEIIGNIFHISKELSNDLNLDRWPDFLHILRNRKEELKCFDYSPKNQKVIYLH